MCLCYFTKRSKGKGQGRSKAKNSTSGKGKGGKRVEPCKHGKDCWDESCRFNHDCKYWDGCYDEACKYSHPWDKAKGRGKGCRKGCWKGEGKGDSSDDVKIKALKQKIRVLKADIGDTDVS